MKRIKIKKKDDTEKTQCCVCQCELNGKSNYIGQGLTRHSYCHPGTNAWSQFIKQGGSNRKSVKDLCEIFDNNMK